MKSLLHSSLYKLIIALTFVVIVAMALLSTGVAAAETAYSGVLDDLKTDENFNIADYPANSEDYSLSVIQIAESEDGELFIYVYKPYTGGSYDLTATSINMSLFYWNTDNTKYMLYSLSLINEYGVLQKYLVDGLTVSSDSIRYYDISTIYRDYYSDIDGEDTNGNSTNEVAFSVAQCWQASTYDGETYYYKEETKVVTISSYAGFVRYESGKSFYWGSLSFSSNYSDSHFIAFDCNYDIEELYEVDVSFVSVGYEEWRYYIYGSEDESYRKTNYGDTDSTYSDNPLTVKYTETATVNNSGVFGLFDTATYTWNRICTVDDFISDLDNDGADYDSDFINNISDKQWVVRFYETECNRRKEGSSDSFFYYVFSGSNIQDIAILRLNFLCKDTVYYNLGTVCNKITESIEPSVTVGIKNSSCADIDWLGILQIILFVFLLFLLLPFLPTIVSIVVWVISLPFKLLSAIYKTFKKLFKKDSS